MSTARVGQCEVMLTLDRDVVHWDEQITGTVFLLGGRRDQRLRRLTVRLNCEYYGETGAGTAFPDLLPETWTNVKLRAGEHLDLPFQLDVVWGSCLGVPCYAVLESVGHAFWETAVVRTPLTVLPPAGIQAMMQEVAALTGFELRSWVYARGDGIKAAFEPTLKAHPRIARVSCEIFRANGRLSGHFTLGIPTRKPRGPFQAADPNVTQFLPFRIHCSDLENGPALMGQLLQPYLADTLDLPIPSAGPALQATHLPLPASPVEVDSANLPRVTLDD